MVAKFNTWCPLFPGFYGTHFEYDNEDNDIESYNEENKTDLNWDDFEWNYKEYRERVSKAFVNRLERELEDIFPVKMTFQQLSSPKEYNFYNDSIWVSVEVDLDKLIEKVRKDYKSSAEYFKNKYTSCSGFISFHSPHLEMWIDKEYILKEPGHRVGALLDCLCSQHFSYDDIIYWTEGENYIDFVPKMGEYA